MPPVINIFSLRFFVMTTMEKPQFYVELSYEISILKQHNL